MLNKKQTSKETMSERAKTDRHNHKHQNMFNKIGKPETEKKSE